MMPISKQGIAELLQGAYDLHIHPSPSPFSRKMDDIELLRAADSAGMAGILLKSHYEPTAARAIMANTYADTMAQAYGALVLNWSVGGLNPYAVHNALKRGTRIIYMPTRDAKNSLVSGNMPGDFFDREGLAILDGDGTLKEVVFEIMDLVKAHNASLATGHISVEESLLLCKAGRERGVRMVLTHPEYPRTKVPVEHQIALAQCGVLIEHCWYNLGEAECSGGEMAANIRAVGCDHCYISTDRGQSGREPPVEAMIQFIETLMEEGISKEQLRIMLTRVPQQVLALK